MLDLVWNNVWNILYELSGDNDRWSFIISECFGNAETDNSVFCEKSENIRQLIRSKDQLGVYTRIVSDDILLGNLAAP